MMNESQVSLEVMDEEKIFVGCKLINGRDAHLYVPFVRFRGIRCQLEALFSVSKNAVRNQFRCLGAVSNARFGK
jgi:hypothetical protein